MDTETIIIIAGIVAYILMRKQLLKNYSKKYVKCINATLVIPIMQIVFFSLLYSVGDGAIKSAREIDRLHNISTYTPYLGDLGTIADIANQSGLLSDIERSQSTLEFISAAGMANNIVTIGILIVVILALAELYGVFRLGKFTKKRILIFYYIISAIFLISSIFLGIYIEKYIAVLSSVFSGIDEYPFTFIFPIMTIVLMGMLYIPYSRAVKKLYSQETASSMSDSENINS
ncbi:hypothetical protein [uncultured Phocaeicola sp.]|uniref:hypothetical protein n=1 Tax=uncultured Phocaeicola sp. TaxID=990718 RepID=UPI0025926B97|nr:hypothetical protein [uncultured Phocaeicola sp.]